MPLWIAATLAAFFVKGLCGFANTLVFTSVLSFGVSNAGISPVELLLGLPTNAILAWRERRSLDLSLCLPLAALVLLGLIIVLSAQMLAQELRPRPARLSRVVLGIIGLLSGLLCGLYGVGALLGAYVSRVARDSHAFKANLCFVFLAENLFRIGLYAVCGLLTPATLLRALILAPFMLAGLFLGMRSAGMIAERTARRLVIALLLVSGVSLIGACL